MATNHNNTDASMMPGNEGTHVPPTAQNAAFNLQAQHAQQATTAQQQAAAMAQQQVSASPMAWTSA